jgi:hypothetical protein
MSKRKTIGLQPVSEAQRTKNRARTDEITKARIIQRLVIDPVPFRTAIAMVHLFDASTEPTKTIHGVTKKDLDKEFKKAKREVKRLRTYKHLTAPRGPLRKELFEATKPQKPRTYGEEMDAKGRRLEMEGHLMQNLFGRKGHHGMPAYQAAGEMLRTHPHKLIAAPNGKISHKRFMEALKRREKLMARKRATQGMANIANALKKAGPIKKFKRRK